MATTDDGDALAAANMNDTAQHPDTILFGSLPSELADDFAERIDVALREGVSSLPLLPQQTTRNDDDNTTPTLSGEELFLQQLRSTYIRNVDVLESYIMRNIFTIQNYPKHQRDKILHCLTTAATSSDIDGVSAAKRLVGDALEDNDESFMTNATTTAHSFPYPSLADIPSEDALETLRQETKQLRAKLREARLHRNDVLCKLNKLTAVDQSVKGVNETLTAGSTTTTDIHQSITAMLLGKQGLEQLQTVGQSLSKNLDDEKEEYSDEDENMENKRPKLSLDAQYEQLRQKIKTSPSGLQNMTKLLQKK